MRVDHGAEFGPPGSWVIDNRFNDIVSIHKRVSFVKRISAPLAYDGASLTPFLQPRAEVEMVYASGVFRVAIEYKQPLLVLLLEATGIFGVLFWGWDRGWWQLIPGFRVIGVAILVFNVVALARRMTESQAIEFDDRKVSISRTELGWRRTSDYALEKCSNLEWRMRLGKPSDFVFKYGWRTVSFGASLRQEQADRLLDELQNSLPNVAKR